MWIHPEDLSRASHDALCRIWQTHGVAGNGFFRALAPPPVSRHFFLATALLVVVAFLCLPPVDVLALVPVQAGLFALAVWLIVSGVRIVRPNQRHRGLGNFLFADAQSLWEVSPQQLRVTPLDEVTPLHPRRAEIAPFLDALARLRASADGAALGTDTARLTALAVQHAHGRSDGESNPCPEPLLPCPSPERSRRLTWKRFHRAGVAVILVGLGFVAFAMLVRVAFEEYLFARAAASSFDDLEPVDAFLRAFPNGRRTRQALDLRESRVVVGLRDGPEGKNLAALRQFVADPRNVNCRDEVQGMINAPYDVAIKRFFMNRLNLGLGWPEGLPRGLVHQLEWLKTQPRPVMTVGFRAVRDPRLVPGEPVVTFGPPLTRQQEEEILERLRQGIGKFIPADLLTLERAHEGQPPALEITYCPRPELHLNCLVKVEKPGCTDPFVHVFRGARNQPLRPDYAARPYVREFRGRFQDFSDWLLDAFFGPWRRQFNP